MQNTTHGLDQLKSSRNLHPVVSNIVFIDQSFLPSKSKGKNLTLDNAK